MMTVPVPATVAIGLIVGLILLVHILSHHSSRPSGLRGWLLAILAMGGMVVFVSGPGVPTPTDDVSAADQVLEEDLFALLEEVLPWFNET